MTLNNTVDGYEATSYRKSKRNRGARCVGLVKWPWRSEASPCWHRVERGHTLCVHHRNPEPSRWYLKQETPK